MACVNCKSLERLRALTRVVQGQDPDTQALTYPASPSYTFGPFCKGALVRISTGFVGDNTQAPAVPWGIFYKIGTDSTVLASDAGAKSRPLGSYQWVDIEIVHDKSYISVILDVNSFVGTVLAEITDVIRLDRGLPNGP